MTCPEEKRKDMPTWIAFDIGGTLIHPAAADFAATFGSRGIDPVLGEAAFVRASEAYHWSRGSIHRIPALIQFLSKEFGILEKVAEEVVSDLVSAELYRDTDPCAAGVLRDLRESGLAIGVLTNNEGQGKAQLGGAGLLHLVDVVVESASLGVEKPDLEAFEALAWRIGHPVSAGWYVGDGLINDLLGSMLAGFGRSILLDRFNQWRDLPQGIKIGSLAELPRLLA